MTAKELIEKYIRQGDNPATAWFWANNPENPESPNYRPYVNKDVKNDLRKQGFKIN